MSLWTRTWPPPLALVLGAGGLIPFVALSRPVSRALDVDGALQPVRDAIGRPSLNHRELQVTYGCMILSFLGAPHWGFAFASAPPSASAATTAARLAWGVTPSLIAWPCASMPAPLSLDVLTLGLALALGVDALAWRAVAVPRSYLVLRVPLTLCASLSLQSNRSPSLLHR